MLIERFDSITFDLGRVWTSYSDIRFLIDFIFEKTTVLIRFIVSINIVELINLHGNNQGF